MKPGELNRREFTLASTGALMPLLASCAQASSTSAAPTRPDYTGPLVDPREIPGSFLWQQRVSARHGKKRGGFDAVLQKTASTLLVLGLTPFNTRAFSIEQRGLKFEYKQFVPFELPFSPESVLIDIHRCFFFGLTEETPKEGTRVTRWKTEILRDTFADGQLQERVFANVSSTGEDIVVTYDKPYLPFAPPPNVELHNRAYGYVLRVETSSAQTL